MDPLSKIYKWPLLALLALILLILYYSLNPADYSFFPKCPFYWLTGYKCPGCGSQRAIHQLLHLHLREAFQANPLMVIAIPYILTGFLFDYTSLKTRYPGVRKTLYGKPAIIIAFLIVIFYWIFRNL